MGCTGACSRNSATMFRLEQTQLKGTIMIANEVMLAGALVFEESDPLLAVSKEDEIRSQQFGEQNKRYLAVYDRFCQIDERKKSDYLALYAPNGGKDIHTLKGLGDLIKLSSDEYSKVDSSLFARVACIWKTNAFFNPSMQASVVQKVASRMSHSCLPNAHVVFQGPKCICTTIRTVAKDEEISIEYVPKERLRSAVERRQQFYEDRNFVCVCERCAAPGDDTRQFACESSACPGTHAAAIPPDIYVTPGTALALLPCNVCHRQAGVAYTTACQRDEEALEDGAAQLGPAPSATVLDEWSAAQCRRMLRLLDALPQLPYHARSGALFCTRLHVTHRLFLLNEHSESNKAALINTGHRYAAWLQRVHPFPSTQLAREYGEVLTKSLIHCTSSTDKDATRVLSLSTLRTLLMLYGRVQEGRAHLDTVLQSAGWVPAPPHDLQRCAYCEECPENAALSLSLCGRCRRVAYCSLGCQRAHWKAHKTHCSTA